MKNKLPEHGTVITFSILAGALQDMWHYAALIKPPADGRESTFKGDRYYLGLQGKLRAYESLCNKVAAFQVDELPAFLDVVIRDASQFETVAELVEQTGYIIHAINLVCQANGIDGFTGERKQNATWTCDDCKREWPICYSNCPACSPLFTGERKSTLLNLAEDGTRGLVGSEE